ncbi:ammonium transporter [Pelagicoccus mobilis]|uniref:Ammonium transporter n=1 Tax=Pelagicoccus mobilis TaxID=415221 RepID=A0A934VTC9_9BACT|nr:ammonium transporter [Pelagicoccus mobilis]MBK1879578.1 ammonium transporter [Pelagicoccus mobilis]
MESSSLDHLWLIVCAALVFIMQGGFLCLESGCTRTKNSINVAVKNLTDFAISVLGFWICGFGLMFGLSNFGLFGGSQFFFELDGRSAGEVAFFVFQVMFCGTSVTIVSGAVSERMSFKAYLWVSALVSVIIYPLFGHWAWGGVWGGDSGWLSELGFIDFAGSSVVHGIGGWVALACIVVIGPRIGRFDESGKPQAIHGQSLPLALLGTLLLCFGWIGFNGGSTLAWGGEVPGIVANTILAASSGLLTALCVGYYLLKYPDLKFAMNGMLAGLVAITACCHMVSSVAAIVIGSIGAVVMVFSDRLVERWGLDDVVGSVSVHAFAGAWGTLAVALFGQSSYFAEGASRIQQLGVQGLGVVCCVVFGFFPAYFFLKLISNWIPLRVGEMEELKGLNESEHRVSTEHLDLLREMERQSRQLDLSRRVSVEPFTEVGQIARKYNELLGSLEQTVARNELIIRDTMDGILTCSKDGRVMQANPGACSMFGREVGGLSEASIWDLIKRSDGERLESFEQMSRIVDFNGADLNAIPFCGIRGSDERFPVQVETSAGTIGRVDVFNVKIRDRSQSEKYKDMLRKSKSEAERTRDQLEEKVSEVESFNRIAIDRELKMVALKKEINRLSSELDREPPYKAGANN